MNQAKITTGEAILENEVIQKRSEKYLSECELKIKKAISLNDKIELLKSKIDFYKEQLDEIDNFFKTELKHLEIIETPSGSVKKTVKNSYELLQSNVSALKELFPDDFDALIGSEIKYTAKKELKDMLVRPIGANQKAVSQCFLLKSSTSVKYENPIELKERKEKEALKKSKKVKK